MLGWVIRLLAIALLIRLAVDGVTALSRLGSGGSGRSSRRVPPAKGGSLVRDPVCGTYVEPARAVSTRTGDAVIYFCSETCRRTFLKSA